MFGYRFDRATLGVGVLGLLAVCGVYLVMIDHPFRRRSIGFLLSVLLMLTVTMFALALTRVEPSGDAD